MFITKTIAQGTLRPSGAANGASPGRRRGRHGLLRIVVVSLAVVFALAACDTTSSPAAGGDPVTMGVLSCFTGLLPGLGEAMWQGGQVAQKAINDAGGILRRQLNLAHADTQCDEADSVPALRQLRNPIRGTIRQRLYRHRRLPPPGRHQTAAIAQE